MVEGREWEMLDLVIKMQVHLLRTNVLSLVEGKDPKQVELGVEGLEGVGLDGLVQVADQFLQFLVVVELDPVPRTFVEKQRAQQIVEIGFVLRAVLPYQIQCFLLDVLGELEGTAEVHQAGQQSVIGFDLRGRILLVVQCNDVLNLFKCALKGCWSADGE
jgi:hypothetical protein